MAQFSNLTMTTKGFNLQSKVQTGIQLSFTKVQCGDGSLVAGETIASLTALKSAKLTCTIASNEVIGDGTSRVRTVLSNTGLATGFFFREVGLFAQDPTEGEILYAYANAGTYADYIPAGTANTSLDDTYDLITVVGAASNVTASIPSDGYVSHLDADIQLGIVGATLAETVQKTGAIEKELDKWQNQRLLQGTVTLYNKSVLEGCVISAMPNSRYLQFTRTGTYVEGNISKAYVDGKIIGINDTEMLAMVPQYILEGPNVYYVYIDYDASSGKYKPFLDSKVPDGKLTLYKITVPAGDNKMDLSLVNIQDTRRIENSNVFLNTKPFALVSLPGYPQLSTDYAISLTVQSASDIGAVGDLIAYGKQANGFKIKVTGSADNVEIKWTLMNPGLK